MSKICNILFFVLLLLFSGEIFGKDWDAGLTYIIQIGTSSTQKESSYSLDFILEKEKEDSKVFFHFEAGKGEGIDRILALYSGVNRDAGDSGGKVEVTEAWYEHRLGKLTLTLGVLDPTCYLDQNEFANDETTQFLSFIFRNNQAINFPDNNTGIHLSIDISDYVEFESELIETDTSLGNPFYSFQTDLKFFKESNLRLFYWWNKNEGRNQGYGISFDKSLNDLGFFLRYSKQNILEVNKALSFGIEKLFKKSRLGIGIGKVYVSNRSEEHLEFYYNFFLFDNLQFSPNIQIISDSDKKRNFISGTRLQFYF